MTAAAPVAAPRGSTTVLRPTLGLYLDRPSLQVPDQGMSACRNVRIKDGEVRNENMGWQTFPASGTPINLDNTDVLLIDQLFLRNGSRFLLFANRYDLFLYDEVAETVSYITPLYTTGTIDGAVYAAGPDETTLTGAGTAWDTPDPARNGLDNVRVGDRIHIGAANEQAQSATWFTVKAVNSATEIVVDGDATAGFPGSFPYTARQTFTGDLLDDWQSDTFPAADTGGGFEDRWYATNGVDAVVRYRGPTVDPNGATWVDLGFTCQTLRYDNNIMLYAGLVEASEFKPQAIRNSDVGFPEVVDGTGLSSEFTVGISTEPIQQLFPLGDVMVVYSQTSISTMQFVGDPFIYAVRTAITDRGLLAPNSLADFGNYHEVLSSDTIYRFNGVGIEEYASHIWREVLRTISPQRRVRLLSHIDEENGEVQWVVPLTNDGTGDTGAPKSSYQEHYLEEVGNNPTPYTFRDLPATATGFFERQTTLTWDQVLTEWINTNFRWNDRFFEAAFPFSLFGDSGGYVYILNAVDFKQTPAGGQDPITSSWTTPRRAVIDGRRKGLVKRVEPYVDTRPSANYGLNVTVLGSDRAQGDATQKDNGAYAMDGSGERFVPLRAAARYAEINFSTVGVQRPYAMGGYGIEVRGMGSR